MLCSADPSCPYPRIRTPKGVLSPLCSWHRLLRTSMDAQIREAERRLSAAPAIRRARVPAEVWPTGERWCSGCQSFVPLFYCTGSRCKPCAAKAARAGHLKRTYGLSENDARDLLALQDGRCAICRKHQNIKAPAADHDHAAGPDAVRGFLCQRCNHDLLGAAFDSERIIAAALVYLVAPPSSGNWRKPEVVGDAVISAVRGVLGC